MKLYIPVLKKEEGKFFHYSESLRLEINGGDEDPVMNIDLQVAYVRPNVLIKGNWHVQFKGECSRCMEQSSFIIKDSFYEEFNQLSSGEDLQDHYVHGDIGDVCVFKGDTLDLGEYFRQSYFMSQPLKILCKSECKGLCPVCGINKNKGDCNCNEGNIDPRWALLQKIKEKTLE
ncbi:MAG: DUF177 domain-containing protein [Bacillota bacterium]|nr:DUF177 domain-containing protein [Bacillota bacterium]